MQKPDMSQFPATPGVYIYKDAAGRILYIGKARRLRQRIASYFRDEKGLTPKTRAMLRNAVRIEVLHTSTEKEALLLEASLIKKHRPRYNIVLRDDKEYLLFRIGAEHPFPRVEIIRREKVGRRMRRGKLFGPFSSSSEARQTWRLIHKHFPLRRCRDRVFANRTRPCLYHDMGQCLGPCVLPVSAQDYRSVLHKVEMLLSGRSRELADRLRTEMLLASENLEFEKAAYLRDQLQAVERTLEQQSVVLPKRTDIDIIGVGQTEHGLALGIVFVRDGLMIDRHTFFWPGLSVEDTPELLLSFLGQFYLKGQAAPPPRVVVPWLPDSENASPPGSAAENADAPAEAEDSLPALEQALSELREGNVQLTRPRDRNEDNLALLAAANAVAAVRHAEVTPMADILAARLHAPEPVRRIEVVDISHTSGRQTRAGMVVFEDEEPLPSAFRTYALDAELEETAHSAGDDYAALAAWARRRATAGEPWPDLVLVDGGKGQLAAVHRAFTEAGVADRFLLASIAKARDDETGLADRRRAGTVEDRIFLPGRSNPLSIRAGSPELLFLQRIRDAAHDFVIGRHRRARAAATLSGELTRLPGVGPKLARCLFDRFGSLAAMAGADEETLRQVPGIGRERAAMLRKRLQSIMGGKTGK